MLIEVKIKRGNKMVTNLSGNTQLVKSSEDLKTAILWTFISIYGVFVGKSNLGMIITIIAAFSAIAFYAKWTIKRHYLYLSG